MTCTTDKLVAFVRTLGVLYAGSHRHTADCCILEAVSLCEGKQKTDSPSLLDRPDCRPLNDSRWASPEVRASQMLRLAPLLEAWPKWSASKRAAWCEHVALRMVRDVLPIVAKLLVRQHDAPEIPNLAHSLKDVSRLADAMMSFDIGGTCVGSGVTLIARAARWTERAYSYETSYPEESRRSSASAAALLAEAASNLALHAWHYASIAIYTDIFTASVQAWADAAALVAATPD